MSSESTKLTYVNETDETVEYAIDPLWIEKNNVQDGDQITITWEE